MMNEKFMPMVSIVIPVYNGSNYLRSAIDCALSQDYPNFEVIVVNDGSTDGGETDTIARSYGDRIRYFVKENGGVSSALNLALSVMEGEYFSWLSHDDLYTPNKLTNGISLLSKFPDKIGKLISFSWGNYIDENGVVLRPFHKRLEECRPYSPEEMVEYMLRYGTMNGCCMLIPKEAFDACGDFEENLRYSQDTLMWFTFFLYGYGLVFDGNPDVMYRIHRKQTSKTRRDLFERDSLFIADKLGPELRKTSKDNQLLYLFAKRNAVHDCPGVVARIGEEARKIQPFSLKQNLSLKVLLAYSKVRRVLKKLQSFFS